jgi:hypothetical protein
MPGIKKRKRVTFAFVLGAAGLAVFVQLAFATHPRPKGASPIRVSLVPAYEECTAPNRTHGPPLAFPSCSPPVQSSDFVTVGTPDANGASANSVGFLRIRVDPSQSQDVTVSGSITDVRCKAGAAPCGAANAADGPDYVGELLMDATIRITDHNSGPDFNEPATVVDIPFPVSMSCSSTSDTSIGGTCSVMAGPVALFPETSVPPRAVVEISQVQVFDGGRDGTTTTNDGTTLFAVQGIFIP